MIKKLKIQFILTIVTIISLIMLIILISINSITNNNLNKKIMDSLNMIAVNDGIIKPVNYSIYRGNNLQAFNLSFSIKLDKNNNILEVIYPIELGYTETELKQILESTLSSTNNYCVNGNISSLKMQKHYGQIIVFLDITNYNNTKSTLLHTSIWVFIISLILIFAVSYFLTEWIIKPVRQNFEMQKQFIANASHELKTPLSVISTNISILSYENDLTEQKKWIDNAKAEIFKMNDLINKLLLLSKTELLETEKTKENINISNTISNAILSYESILFEENRILNQNIEPDIFIKAIEDDITTLIRIFLDNAIKYSNSNDVIAVELKRKNEIITLSIFNTGIGIKTEDINYIFDRFYRVDTSRNKEIEGYGLGLSIVKKIIDNNKWKIKTESVYANWVKFTITF